MARFPSCLLAALLACDGGAADDDHAVVVDAAPPDTAGGARTLDTCTTSIAPDAPALFRRYFRCVTITTTASAVIIQSEGLPPHPTYYYGEGSPNFAPFDTSRPGYHPNPNQLAPQALRVTIPREPVASGVTITPELVDGLADTNPAEYALGTSGIALDSVAMFKGTAAAGDDLAEERFTFDSYQAHPQARGIYHYHAPTPGPLEVLARLGMIGTTTPGAAAIELYGIMCDGTVVLGCAELDGGAPSGLDAQGGHVHDLRDRDGVVLAAGRYHTHLCSDPGRGHPYTPEIHYYQECAP